LLQSDEVKDINQKGIIKLAGDLLRMLAGASISHGDFKATNFILSNGKLFVIDLDAMREHRFRWRFRRAFRRDLKRLVQNWADRPEIEKMFLDQINRIEL
jgi:serine/threonine-protein kinase RIO1